MSFKQFFPLLIFLLINSGCNYFGVKKKEKLISQTDLADTISVYCPLLYTKDSIGKLLQKITFDELIKPKDLNCPAINCQIYKLNYLKFSPDLSGELICFFNENTSNEEVYFYFYENKVLKSEPILMAELYSYEGVDAERNSWIFDYNQDGFPDVYSKFISNNYKEGGLQLAIKKEEFLFTWNPLGKFDTILIDNSSKWTINFLLHYTELKE